MAKDTYFLVTGQSTQDNLKKEKSQAMDHILINKMYNLEVFGIMENLLIGVLLVSFL
jgi:hypothetical protein